jgi:hypothetical protein
MKLSTAQHKTLCHPTAQVGATAVHGEPPSTPLIDADLQSPGDTCVVFGRRHIQLHAPLEHSNSVSRVPCVSSRG